MEKRLVFMDRNDHLRFIQNLIEFNNIELSPPSNVRFSSTHPSQLTSSHLEQLLFGVQLPKKRLVDILAFCLMSNHYHLLLRQHTENGIVRFMQKLGTGYTNYFNIKYDRVGPLFQGRFKAILINTHHQLLYIPHYIHLNPLESIEPKWREGTIKNLNKAIHFLDNYKWSSFADYTGKRNFAVTIKKNVLLKLYGNPQEYKKSILEWLKSIDLQKNSDIILE
ncbi:MAG: transposase [Patescibacteria group bacterium]